MFRWVPYPFLRIAPLFMLGIGVASWVNSQLAIFTFIITFLAYSAFTFFGNARSFSRLHPWVGSFAAFCLILLGIIRAHQHDTTRQSDHLLHFTDTADYYIATVIDHPEPKKNSYRVTLDIEHIFNKKAGQGLSQSARVIVYQPKADSSWLMHFGDRVLVKGIPDPVELPKNPAEFNYKQYLAYQGIHHQQYLRASNWTLMEANVRPYWLGLTGNWRHQCRDKLLQYIKNPQAQGIALAITLGLKSHLEREVQEAYAATGAMHVLAVSGLHVGIIYLILNFLLAPFRQLPKVGTAIYITGCIVGLWLYALLTGLSPSVQRAAVMFTFIIIGSTLRRQSDIYNTLACSAFLLLWIDPFLLYSVGFQLSYLAVFGIVYLQPRIYAWCSPNTKVMDWLWQLTSVSIAAQIATFPLGMYYFHQFPIYFWISNVVVIPGALLILPLGLATLFTGFTVPALAKVCGWVLEHLIQFVNTLVALIQQLPGSTIEQIAITPVQTGLLYLIIVFFILLFHYRRLRYFSLAVASLALVVAIQAAHMYRQHQEISMTVYNVKDDTHLDFTQGFTNLHRGSWDTNAQYHVLPNHIQKGLQTEYVSDTLAHPALQYASGREIEMLHWQGKTIAIIREQLNRSKPEQPVSVDYLIVAHNAIRKLAHLNDYFSYQQLIIDGTNSRYTTQKLVNEADREHIACHAVSLQGALTIPWKP
ncbi:MAG: ComEC/Rec2 family competence protein [Cyclobacteriaceae bacterium]